MNSFSAIRPRPQIRMIRTFGVTLVSIWIARSRTLHGIECYIALLDIHIPMDHSFKICLVRQPKLGHGLQMNDMRGRMQHGNVNLFFCILNGNSHVPTRYLFGEEG